MTYIPDSTLSSVFTYFSAQKKKREEQTEEKEERNKTSSQRKRGKERAGNGRVEAYDIASPHLRRSFLAHSDTLHVYTLPPDNTLTMGSSDSSVDSTDTPFRYAAYANRVRTILISAHRYVRSPRDHTNSH